jgi:two-component system phosphate regulon sensor histidine kinase PhoR
MRNGSVFRILVVLGVSCLGGLLVVQIYWLSAAYKVEERHLQEKIALALRDVTNRLTDTNTNGKLAILRPVASNRFEITYDQGVTYSILDSIVRSTFVAHDLLIPFELVGYDGYRDVAFGNLYQLGAASSSTAMCLERGSAQARTKFTSITFHDQPSTIVGGMQLWIFSASMFMIVLAGALIMMIKLSREKRRAEFRADFISNMTHELQTPIANIALASDVLKKEKDASGRCLHYAHIISSENQRLRSHIDQVLQTALLEKGELALSRQEVNLNNMVMEIASVFSERIKLRGGQLSVNADAHKPVVFADALHLKNLLYNLLDNAEKYSPDTPQISVTTRDHRHGVSVAVTDKGLGIEREHQARIFDKFFRASKGNVHDIKGFGLGLTYVKGIVEAHNGTVTVSSAPGEGSRFEVLLQNFS